MDIQQQMMYLNLGIVVVTAIAFVYYVGQAKLKDSGKYAEYKKAKVQKQYLKLYNSVIFRNPFRRLVSAYSSMCCYSKDQLQEKSVETFNSAVRVSLGFPIVIGVLVQDVLLVMLTILLSMIYYNMTVNKKIDELHINMLRQTSNTIQSIRENYMQTDNIASAILLSDKENLVETPMLMIYELLVDVNGTELLDEFCRKSPLRLLMSLAMSCYIMMESGDEKKADGSSTFADTLTALRQEADAEIRRLKKTEIAFKSLNSLALVGVACMPFAELFNISQIPGTSVLLKGLYGQVSKAVIVVVTIFVYYIISVMTRPSVVNQTDMNESVYNLSRNKIWYTRFLKHLIPKNFKTRTKLKLMMQGAISSKTFEYIYTMKFLAATAISVATLTLLLLFTYTAKDYVYHNTGSLGFIPAPEMEEDVYVKLEKLDQEYLEEPVKPTEDQTLNAVKGTLSKLSDLEQLEQVDRLQLKYDTYHGLTFKWYYILIAYLAGLIAWFSPEMSLKLRQKMVEYEADEDVLQIQTLMIVIANTKLDVFKVLYWLQRQSTVHKAPIRFAYQEYTSNPTDALLRLKVTVGNLDLKRIVSKLDSATYKLSIKDAFSDVHLNKEQALRMREMLQEETLESKKQWAKLICIMPAALMLVLIFMGPIFLLGITELMKMMEQLGGV